MHTFDSSHLYDRPPLTKDVFFFALALALHFPLFHLKIAGRKQGAFQPITLHKIDFILQPVSRPPKVEPKPVEPKPAAPAPKEAEAPKPVAAVPVPTPAPIVSRRPFVVRSEPLPPTPEAVDLRGPEVRPAGIAISPGASAAPVVVQGKSGFAVRKGEVEGISGPTTLGGVSQTITLPTANRARAEIPAAPAVKGKTYAAPVLTSKPSYSPAAGGFAATAIPHARPVAAPAPKAGPVFAIAGPLADRAIVRRVLPALPEWARVQGLSSAVTLRFVVSPDGKVKDTILILKTSGYPDVDRSAIEAIKDWLFVRISPEEPDQMGTIVMTFQVR